MSIALPEAWWAALRHPNFGSGHRDHSAAIRAAIAISCCSHGSLPRGVLGSPSGFSRRSSTPSSSRRFQGVRSSSQGDSLLKRVGDLSRELSALRRRMALGRHLYFGCSAECFVLALVYVDRIVGPASDWWHGVPRRGPHSCVYQTCDAWLPSLRIVKLRKKRGAHFHGCGMT